MSDDGTEDEIDEQPILSCARLLACGHIDVDLSNPDDGYSLRNVIVHIRPNDGLGFPFRIPRIYLFAQMFGIPNEYLIRARMSRLEIQEGEIVEVGTPLEFGPWEILLPDDGNYMECFGFPLHQVPFREPGVYEFQLWADGIENMLYNERVEVRE